MSVTRRPARLDGVRKNCVTQTCMLGLTSHLICAGTNDWNAVTFLRECVLNVRVARTVSPDHDVVCYQCIWSKCFVLVAREPTMQIGKYLSFPFRHWYLPLFGDGNSIIDSFLCCQVCGAHTNIDRQWLCIMLCGMIKDLYPSQTVWNFFVGGFCDAWSNDIKSKKIEKEMLVAMNEN